MPEQTAIGSARLPKAETQVIAPQISDRLGSIRRRRLPIQLAWMGVDLVCLAGAAAAAAWILDRPPSPTAWALIGLMNLVRLVIFVRSGMYRAVLRYSGIHTQTCATISVALGSAVAVAAASMLSLDLQAGLGRAFWALEGLISLVVIGGLRLTARMVLERLNAKQQLGDAAPQRVLIYGAGGLGELAMRELIRAPNYHPIGFLDDDQRQYRSVIHGKPVLGGLQDFGKICERHKPDLVVVAITDPPQQQTQALFRLAMDHGLHMLLAKGVGTALDEGGAQLGLRDLALEDLLGRPSRKLDQTPVRRLLAGKRVLVTGAGGSIGSELCRQVADLGIRSLDLLDHSEYNLYAVETVLRESHPDLSITPHLVTLVDRPATMAALGQCRPDVIFHAAAYKHVPLVEANPARGLINNVGGFVNLIDAAEAHAVGHLVLISTDKAVRPTNVMGASKRVCELIMQSRGRNSLITLCAVRFGNVLGSSGSVVPRFMDQIAAGGPVTVTHPEITRYFMLIPEAVSLVLQAGARSSSDEPEIFILDMGEPVKVADLARHLIYMHGKTPDQDIQIAYTGLRPGEKLYEELLTGESDHHTDIPDITVARTLDLDQQQTGAAIGRLLKACHMGDMHGISEELAALVPEWTPSDQVLAHSHIRSQNRRRTTEATSAPTE